MSRASKYVALLLIPMHLAACSQQPPPISVEAACTALASGDAEQAQRLFSELARQDGSYLEASTAMTYMYESDRDPQFGTSEGTRQAYAVLVGLCK